MGEAAPATANEAASPEAASIAAPSPPDSEPQAPAWGVRDAAEEDLAAIVTAVRALLAELGATPPDPAAMEAAARTLVDDGSLFVAEADGELVGVLAASWQTAMHVPGRYALIQDLWVAPHWRGRAVGGALLEALDERARDLGMTRIEVGLPREDYPHIRATEAFYLSNDFTHLGPRMRRTLDAEEP
jgi:GNAT superfamily N-acetyltransferase